MKEFLLEANRCFLCKKPRCKENCPISTPIPQIIELFKNNEVEKAGEILFNNNPMSIVCSIVCPHENQCLGNCIKGIKDTSVKFYEIENFISKEYLKNIKLNSTKKNGDKIAVVGSGPAGITLSIILAQKGYDVTLFEKNEKIGGVLRYGIPEFRLSRDIVDKFEEILKDLKIKIKTNTLVGPVITVDKLLADGYKAIFIGTGVWNPKSLNIKGETLGHVHYAIDYLKSPEKYNLGKKVAVIGAGNVAMDAARSAKHYGSSDVHIVYRRAESDMPATQFEIKEAKEDGIIFDTFKAPLEIKDSGILTTKTKKIENEDGSVKIVTIENTEELFQCDSIIIAVSQAPKSNIVDNTNGLEVCKSGLILTNEKCHTTREGIFACGDVVSGAKTVIEAVVNAKTAANSIDEYCKSLKK
ncbi:NAD(P)-dependent oxidoreductase [Clostridium tarantellae]|uniref:NAD(P)-binding protein n=1 Tax=Clostridium tarantellae TaxID=39493 RepID=A0A6I1MQ50_9CLOT|nr:NAD(P)-dependent oxidoreductase [Clostridium tarantellae]MPQ44943.1 NAD(P)-binding protein [Clostridium tarantellae]